MRLLLELKYNNKERVFLMNMKRNNLPPGTESGYRLDWERQHSNKNEADKEKYRKLKKKIDKLSKKNKIIKRKT